MSNGDTRIAIAHALDGVTGVNGYPVRPKAFKAGDAWPQWGGSERADGRAFLETWRVLIVLPSDETTADTFADEKQAQLVNALSPIIYIDSFAPANLAGDGGDILALLITGRCE